MVEDSRTALTGRLAQLAVTIVLLGLLVAAGGRALFSMPLPDRDAPGGLNATHAVYLHVTSYANPDDEESRPVLPTRKR